MVHLLPSMLPTQIQATAPQKQPAGQSIAVDVGSGVLLTNIVRGYRDSLDGRNVVSLGLGGSRVYVHFGKSFEEGSKGEQPSHDTLVVTEEAVDVVSAVGEEAWHGTTYRKSRPAMTPTATLSFVPRRP